MPSENLVAVQRALANRPPSFLSSHTGTCCHTAYRWFEAMSRSAGRLFPGPPTWIRERWTWGPNDWPLHWCEAVGAPALDCGALGALSWHAFEVCGVRAYPVQLIERFDARTVAHWIEMWRGVHVLPWWWGDLVYHEAVLAFAGETPFLWDPTDNRVVRPCGRAVSIRICPSNAASPNQAHICDAHRSPSDWHANFDQALHSVSSAAPTDAIGPFLAVNRLLRPEVPR
jgi:hypothetical protein